MLLKNLVINICLSLACIVPASVVAQPQALLHKNYAEQFPFVDSVYSNIPKDDSASVIHTLTRLEKWATDNNDKQLAYSFELARYRFLFLKKGKNNFDVEHSVLKLMERTEAAKLKWLWVEEMQTIANYYWNDYDKCGYGFDYALRAYDLYAKASVADFPPKATYLFELGINYMRFKEYAEAKIFLIDGMNVQPVAVLPKRFNILNAIGLCYRNMGAYDSAEYYFNAAYREAAIDSVKVWMGIISGNIGITYYLQGRYKEAIPLIEKDIATAQKPNVNTAKSMAILGDIYLIQNDKKKALELLTQAYKVLLASKSRNDYEVLQNIYPRLAKAYAVNGDLQMAYLFMDSAMIVRDSLASQKNILKLARVQQKQEHEKYESQVQIVAEQKKLHAVIRNSLIGGIILLAVIALLFINRQRLKNNEREQKLLAEKQMAEAEKKMAENDLQSASRQLGDFTRSIQEKNELIEKFSAEIERLQALPCSIELPDSRENLVKLQQSTILTEEQWEEFRTVFEKVHTGFFVRLREKLPDMSPAETRFIALSKLNLNNKEMAGILGISTDAVRMNRHRLRKKLNLNEEDSLEKLIDTI